MKKTTLKNGNAIPRLGQGGWYIGDNHSTRVEEIEALRRGIDLGMTLIDTAEMYGSGRSEALIGEAIAPYNREKLYLVSKVLPNNAGRQSIMKSCEQSLRRLRTDYLDCYLLHWRGSVPIAETVECMHELMAKKRIRSFGVSNLDIDDMEELFGIPGGSDCVINQVLYHLGSRGVEYDLLPMLKRTDTAMMAYCPLAQSGRLQKNLLKSNVVRQLAEKNGATVFQILLAFVLRDKNVIAIPKAASISHVEQNFTALSIDLSDEDVAMLSTEFPAPTRKMALDIQ